MLARSITVAIVLIIVLMPVLLKGFGAPEPRVPGKKWDVSPDIKNTHVIFLSGLSTHCDGTPYNQMGFKYIRRQFSRVGLACNDRRFLKYSYKGGMIKKGRWHPNPYKPEDTGQPIQFSVLYLREMIEELSRHHPQARFLLVGHSLGGRIAFDYVTKYHLNEPGPIKGVVTLNSPLTGSPYCRTDILASIRPIWGSIAVQQLAAEYQLKDKLGIAKTRENTARKLHAKGIHLATFGTEHDFIVNPLTACLVDKHGHPLTEGDILPLNLLSSTLNGHVQILNQERVADYIISVYACTGQDEVTCTCRPPPVHKSL
ncbi:MAG: alpha/beta hydrolase [Firmicutes bacterium]|nr:alpha/beta hydrolase [Bacillota bacterium]